MRRKNRRVGQDQACGRGEGTSSYNSLFSGSTIWMSECSLGFKEKQKTKINSCVGLVGKLHRFSTFRSKDQQWSSKVD